MDNSGLFVPFRPIGRPRKFKTPAALQKAFEDYLDERSKRSLVKEIHEEGIVGKSVVDKTTTDGIPFPVSIEDFCLHLGMSRNWWNELPDEFLGVKTHIGNYLYQHQLNGALRGFYNPNIVARRLGLEEKKRVEGLDGVTIVVNSADDKKKLEALDKLGV